MHSNRVLAHYDVTGLVLRAAFVVQRPAQRSCFEYVHIWESAEVALEDFVSRVKTAISDCCACDEDEGKIEEPATELHNN